METSAITPPKDYEGDVVALRAACPELGEELAGFCGIAAVLDWMQRRRLSQAPVDIIGQDEFHYDFLLQFEPGGRWLSFGVT
jgi:hypothetical protein